jgi:hypothetical protein
VNIRGVMAALDLWELDATAKHALLVVACRADRYTGMATVSTVRVAADMKVHYNTARAALRRLVEVGYLTVDKSPGLSPIWMLTPRVTRGVTPTTDVGGSDNQLVGGSDNLERELRSLWRQPRSGARAAHFAPGSGVLVDFTRVRRETDGDC